MIGFEAARMYRVREKNCAPRRAGSRDIFPTGWGFAYPSAMDDEPRYKRIGEAIEYWALALLVVCAFIAALVGAIRSLL